MHHLFKLIMCSILILITGCTSYNSYVQEKRQHAIIVANFVAQEQILVQKWTMINTSNSNVFKESLLFAH